jgi:hypothetical protein
MRDHIPQALAAGESGRGSTSVARTGDAQLRELLRQKYGLLLCIGTIGIDEQLGIGTDRLTRHPDPLEIDRLPGAPIGRCRSSS